MLKVTVEAGIGRKSVDKWKWINQVGSGIKDELKVLSP